jgi:hypothetical protein
MASPKNNGGDLLSRPAPSSLSAASPLKIAGGLCDREAGDLRGAVAPLILRALDALADGETNLALAALEAALDELEAAA